MCDQKKIQNKIHRVAESAESDMAHLADIADMAELVEENKGLVYHFVHQRIRKFQSYTSYQDDLIQAGMVGLIRAIKRFDESRGIEFSTFASHCVRNEISLECLRISTHGMAGLSDHVRRGKQVPPVRSCDLFEKADGLDYLGWEPGEMDSPFHESDTDQARDRILDELKGIISDVLDDRCQKACWMRWVERKKLREIAQEFGVTKESARKILLRSINKLSRNSRWVHFVEGLKW